MLQLILFLAALYLYFLFVRWLFVSVGPGFTYAIALFFSVAVPIIYVRTLLRVFGRDPGLPPASRNWLFVPVVALVTLVHIDLLWIALGLGMSHIHASFAQDLHLVLGRAVHRSVVNRELLVLAGALLPDGSGSLAQVLFSSAAKSALSVPCVLLARGSWSPMEHPGQPARLWYFHGQALKDLWTVIRMMAGDLKSAILLAHRGIITVTQIGTIFVWPLTIMAYSALLVPIVIAIVASLLMLAAHSLSLGLIWVAAMALSLLLLLMERAVILSRAGYAKCPHAECHASVPLPIFMCPECGEMHDRLLPGRFGVLTRTCRCGDGRLPTLFWRGKGGLPSLCPHCRKEMNEELFGGSVHIPIYGGPVSGKTMFMMAVCWELLEGRVPGVGAALIREASDRAYSSYWKPDFESGRVRDKTANPFPDAFLIAMCRGFGLPSSVYLYDPAGEALLNESDLEVHRFMSYSDGLALLIDPLSLPSFAERYRELGGPDLSMTTSGANPVETVTRVVNQLQGFGRLSLRRSSSLRLAVVFTKSDVPGFAEEVGISLTDGMDAGGNWKNLGADDSSRLRDWLRRNEPDLLQAVEMRFRDVRFFAVSALGHPPQAGVGFQPRRVMEPLGWLLASRSTFAHPLLGRALGRMREAAAVLAVLVLFFALILLPVWAFLRWGLR